MDREDLYKMNDKEFSEEIKKYLPEKVIDVIYPGMGRDRSVVVTAIIAKEEMGCLGLERYFQKVINHIEPNMHYTNPHEIFKNLVKVANKYEKGGLEDYFDKTLELSLSSGICSCDIFYCSDDIIKEYIETGLENNYDAVIDLCKQTTDADYRGVTSKKLFMNSPDLLKYGINTLKQIVDITKSFEVHTSNKPELLAERFVNHFIENPKIAVAGILLADIYKIDLAEIIKNNLPTPWVHWGPRNLLEFVENIAKDEKIFSNDSFELKKGLA